MKFIVLHLSDIHIKKTENANPILARAEQIARATYSLATKTESIFILVSGDIAFSGNQEEYRHADKFFEQIANHLHSLLPSCDIRFVFVPGNHDCDFSLVDGSREILIDRIDESDLEKDIYRGFVACQINFSNFIKKWKSKETILHEKDGILWQELHKLSDKVIKFNLINSAWMSKIEEQQGKLLYPYRKIDELNGQNTSPEDVVISVFHHPYNWFEASNSRKFRESIEKCSDMIFTGHEHEGEHYQKSRGSAQKNDYLEGEVLQESDKPNKSEFHVVSIDLSCQLYQIATFTWNLEGKYYKEEEKSEWLSFCRNNYRLKNSFILHEKFENYLLDPGTGFTHHATNNINLDDLFVYPNLRNLQHSGDNEWLKTLVRNNIPDFILESKKILLMGPEKCGKTSIAKKLFREFRNKNYIPLLVSGTDLKDISQQGIISALEQSFSKEYSSPDISLFHQCEKSRRVIIIDDYQKNPFNSKGRDRIIRSLENIFDMIVIISDDQIRFTDLSPKGDEDRAIWRYLYCEILPFGHLQRANLIRKWLSLGNEFTSTDEVLLQKAMQAQKLVSMLLGNNFLPSYPIFILIILQQLEARTPVETSQITGSYGYLYESLLTTALARSSKLNIGLDTQYTYLTEFSYYLFSKKKHRLSLDDIRNWHTKYCKDYQTEIDFDRIYSYFCEASVICEEDNSVSFKYLYQYYYFVARYFRDHIGEDSIREYIDQMSKQLYKTESANIYMFLCYLSKDPFVLNSIMAASRQLFSSQTECDLLEDTKFLNVLAVNTPKVVLKSLDVEANRHRMFEEQDKLDETNGLYDRKIDDYDEESDSNIEENVPLELLQINAAFKNIQILGQVLRNFSGSLKGEHKVSLANECYSLGLRLLKYFYSTIEKDQDEMTLYVAQLLREKYPKWSEERLANQVTNYIFGFTESLAFILIKHISDSVGLDSLFLTFNEILEKTANISYKYIDLSLKLDYHRGFPTNETFDLHKLVRKKFFALHLLQHLVSYYFYLYPAKYDLREAICKKLDIKLQVGNVKHQSPKLLNKGKGKD